MDLLLLMDFINLFFSLFSFINIFVGEYIVDAPVYFGLNVIYIIYVMMTRIFYSFDQEGCLICFN